MGQLKSASRYIGANSGMGALLPLLIGSVFLVLAGLWVYSASSCCGVGAGVSSSLSFGFLVFVAFGVMCLWGGMSHLRLRLKLGPGQAFSSEMENRPGRHFDFTYRQRCGQRCEIRSLGLFLVFRERVEFYNVSETESQDVDRLVQTFRRPGRVYRAGEFIEAEQVFEIPARRMGIRNSLMGRPKAKVETMWVVKVRVDLGRGHEVWNEYEVARGPQEAEISAPTERPNGWWDVILMDSGRMAFNGIMKVMSELLPHLDSGQIGDLYFGKPALLLEHISEEEARSAKAKLEEAGATVVVKPSVDG